MVRANADLLITTDYCVDETLTLLAARRHPRLAIEAGQFFFQSEAVQLHFLSRSQIERSWILFQQRITSGWSFTDCTSKIVIDDINLTTALALDQHFAEFGVVMIP